jgi:tetratricopeptide (TPR) repeat protein
VQAIQAGIEANRRAGYPHFTSWYVTHLGWLARLRGHDDEAVTQGRRALALIERYPHPWALALGCAMLGSTLLLAGDRAEAIRLFERGLAAAEEAGVESGMLRCAAPLAAATGSRGVLDQAAGVLAAATIPDGGAWVLGDEAYLSLARAWLACGEPERARAVLAPLLAVARRMPWIAALAAALAVDGRALIKLGDRETAASELRQAAQLAREHGLPHVLREAVSARRGLRLARAG